VGQLPETISPSEIKKVVSLSKLAFSDTEIEKFSLEINNIITHFDKLNQLDLNNVSPTSHISWRQPPTNPDEPHAWAGREEVISHAPAVVDGYFIVPKVVDKQEE